MVCRWDVKPWALEYRINAVQTSLPQEFIHRCHSTSLERSRTTPRKEKPVDIEMARKLRALVDLPNDLGLVPSTHTHQFTTACSSSSWVHCLLGFVDSCTHRPNMCTDIKWFSKAKQSMSLYVVFKLYHPIRFSKRSVFESKGSPPPNSCCGWGVGLGFILVVFEARCHYVALAVLELLCSRLASNS